MFCLCPRRGKNKVNGSWLDRKSGSNDNGSSLNDLNYVCLGILIRISWVCWGLNCFTNFDMMKAAVERKFIKRVETDFSWGQRTKIFGDGALSVSMDKTAI